ncbi:hypothetical protein PR048_002222 [Dryococelus australis]|uniref:Uncharacterized protein n=1 Tax=Dryococelus australis TaxID=614101 RepID=A0ABQ9IJR8_9NEOP|nr:hypothetical protein PR048_002222 [Dryococelus australis]
MIFLQLFYSVIEGLEIISSWTDSVTATKEYQLLCAAKQPESIVALYINADLVVAIESAILVEEAMKDLRENANAEFWKVFVGVKKKKKRILKLTSLHQGGQEGICTKSTFPQKWWNRLKITTELLLHSFCGQFHTATQGAPSGSQKIN